MNEIGRKGQKQGKKLRAKVTKTKTCHGYVRYTHIRSQVERKSSFGFVLKWLNSYCATYHHSDSSCKQRKIPIKKLCESLVKEETKREQDFLLLSLWAQTE